MKFASIPSLSFTDSITPEQVNVEAAIRPGLPGFSVSGMKGTSIRSITDRIRAAFSICQISLPYCAIQLNVSPVDLAKKGSSLDLSMVAALLIANGYSQLSALCHNSKTLFIGEISLSGQVLPIEGMRMMVLEASRQGFDLIVCSRQALPVLQNIPVKMLVIPIETISDLLYPLNEIKLNQKVHATRTDHSLQDLYYPPFIQKALAASAAGWHSTVLIGPPGTGKSSAARIIAALLPVPDEKEVIEIIQVQEKTNPGQEIDIVKRPLRSPHHSSTVKGMVGGGIPFIPGEVTTAHLGTLILDEFAEFNRNALQALREPMDSGKVFINRATVHIQAPARFLLIATTNPCPCGNFRSMYQQCSCESYSIQRYRNRICGPLSDRIDIELEVEQQAHHENALFDLNSWVEAVDRAVAMQKERYRYETFNFNGNLRGENIEAYCGLQRPDTILEWKKILPDLPNHRSRAGLRRLARTYADMAGSAEIRPVDILEAYRLRILDTYCNHLLHKEVG